MNIGFAKYIKYNILDYVIFYQTKHHCAGIMNWLYAGKLFWLIRMKKRYSSVVVMIIR